MDPFSLTAGCVGIISGIAQTSAAIREFVRDVREARGDLSATARHLTELEMTISLINDDHNSDHGNGTASVSGLIPESMTPQTAAVIRSCRDILGAVDALMDRYNPRRHRTALKWALKGKNDASALNRQLEAHTRTLGMTLEISVLSVIAEPPFFSCNCGV